MLAGLLYTDRCVDRIRVVVYVIDVCCCVNATRCLYYSMYCSICSQWKPAFSDHVASQMQTRAPLFALYFWHYRSSRQLNSSFYVLSSEEMDFYENVRIFKNVATNSSPPAGQNCGSHAPSHYNEAHFSKGRLNYWRKGFCDQSEFHV